MLEIRISNNVAMQLLIGRMEAELVSRKKGGLYSEVITLSKLPFDQLLELTEIAILDLVTLLPYDVMLKETNINEILAKAVQSFAIVFEYSAFTYYTPEKIDKIILPLKKLYKEAEEKKFYVNN